VNTRALHLAADLTLPLRAVTEKIAFLGQTGSGKTYAAMKLAEEMNRVGAQFLALDPVGVWFALRVAADGKGKGLQVPVLGGLHGDLPLEAGAGAIVADLIVDRGVSAVLDVSQFESDADKARFARAFADRFLFRKKAAPSAVDVFIEECQEFAPQNPQLEEETTQIVPNVPTAGSTPVIPGPAPRRQHEPATGGRHETLVRPAR